MFSTTRSPGRALHRSQRGPERVLSHIFINPKARAAYVVAFNTWVDSEDGNARGNTDALDRELKEHLFEHVFPLLGGC